MKSKVLIILTVLIYWAGYSQGDLWKPIHEEELGNIEKLERDSHTKVYDLYFLDYLKLKNILSQAPSRENYPAQQSNVIVPFPNAEGKFENFRIYEASVLHPDLAELHPDIKSYVGKGIDNPTATIRFSTTIFGLHTMTLSGKGTEYIDPYTKDLKNYIVYKKADLVNHTPFTCNVINENQQHRSMESENTTFATQASDGFLRRYRLALACTPQYANYHINQAGQNFATDAQKKATVLAAMNVSMTRINGIYETDMAVTMQLIPTNTSIIYLSHTALSQANSNSGALLNQVQAIINNAIGFNNYDIGHIVSTGAGGVAILGSVCTGNKAMGVTGRNAPVGDPFNVDYVAHEMGHQFGANHTFNNSYQRNAGTAVEPGSGSTIMGYAGISPPNVQSNSDAYFSAASLHEMGNFIYGTGGTCATKISNGNTAPILNTPSSYTIPKSTPFVLKAQATDPNGDALTYCWEQTNTNGAFATVDATPRANSTSGPNYRSLAPTDSPERYFPNFANVLSNNLTPTWEVTPSVARTLNFTVTVRDNRSPNGGQTTMEVNNVFVRNVGPFNVTSQNTANINWTNGTTQTVTWNVGGTNANGINTSNVNILLSTDGGQTFPHILAQNTPNDGSQAIIVPNVQTSTVCRIKVEAVGNIFYALNRNFFKVTGTLNNDEFKVDTFKLYPNPNNGTFSIQLNSYSENSINIVVHDIRGRKIYEKNFLNASTFDENIQLTNAEAGIYLVTVSNGNSRETKKIVIQ